MVIDWEWIWKNIFAITAFIFSSVSLYFTFIKLRRKLKIVASARWRTETGQESTKDITFYAVNKRERVIKVNNVGFAFERTWNATEAHYVEDYVMEEFKILTDHGSFQSNSKTSDFENLIGIHALDAEGKKWQVSGWRLHPIREKKPVLGKMTWMRKLWWNVWFRRRRNQFGVPKRLF